MEVACKGPTELPDSRGLKWPGFAPRGDMGIADLADTWKHLDYWIYYCFGLFFIQPHCHQRRVQRLFDPVETGAIEIYRWCA